MSKGEENFRDYASDVVFEARDVCKYYGGIVALNNVSLKIKKASIHGLLGENGAGKSTLVGLMSGHKTPSSGQLLLHGQSLVGADVQSMEANGVFLVTQEPMVVEQFTVAENLLLGIWPRKYGIVKWGELKKRAKKMLLNTGLDPDAYVTTLDAISRRKLNILRALFSGGEIIILDEPTSALDSKDRDELFDFMQDLKRQDVTCILISHFNEEVLEICDEVSVLRDGHLVDQLSDMSSLNSGILSSMVLGRDLELFYREPRESFDSKDSIQVSDLVGEGLSINDFRVRQGEVVGLVGMPGSGAKTFARTLFGLMRVENGTIQFMGESKKHRIPGHPKEALDRGIAYLSDDRRGEGLVPGMSIGNNMTMSSLMQVARFGVLDGKREKSINDQFFKSMEIKAPNSNVSIDTLSGGNQQKVCLGRVLATQPKLLVLDEPTQGIDVGVKEDVLRLVDKLTESGVSVLIVSSDFDEVVRIADCVCVFAEGQVAKKFSGTDMSPEVLHAATA